MSPRRGHDQSPEPNDGNLVSRQSRIAFPLDNDGVRIMDTVS
jgi:hypothetical protein